MPSKRLGNTVPASHNARVSTTRSTLPSERRAHLVHLAGELFAEKGFRATTVREIADAAGILSGSLYHHFDSKESIGDEILTGFLDDVLAGYRGADADDPRAAIEQIVRTSSATLTRHRAALTMLQRDWNHFGAQPRFAYLRDAMREIEKTWITHLERGKKAGLFRADLDAKLTYRLLRDVLWMPTSWRQGEGGWGTDEVVDAFLRLLFEGINAPKRRRITSKN
ncbi:HTH-type transcriptional repressor KstR2 [Phytohabitans rumicis]|uniref:HTH-type transcriptional repressor KstR2 n=1 Tax=Phytohabitans rumicis TaxID=1076125 RepID=A0A6V8LND2_9ACTN|nr:HTH-type transcriptional repressor KstR2 [Phytohabitans rumicis]